MDIDTTRRIAETVQYLDAHPASGIMEIVPSYGSVIVIYDETVNDTSSLTDLLLSTWQDTHYPKESAAGESITIDVVYGDSCGDDLANVSEITGKSVEEVITLHASATYTVGAVGFVPGFTYLIGLPPELSTPRRATPRLRVPKGSVGIGGNQTGVYALPSAGGWNLIGRSPTTLFDPMADPPVRLKLGDTVRFRPVESADFEGIEAAAAIAAGDGCIEVVVPGFQTTVQDLGRYGVARYGFATEGAADRASLVAANRAVGNDAHTAALEMTHQGPSLRFHHRLRLAIAGADLGARLNGRMLKVGRSFETMPGDELSFHPVANTGGARAYLAVAGGFDVPLIMGSASTSLTSGVGGWHGRALMRGDRLDVGQRELPPSLFAPGLQSMTDPTNSSPLRIVPGPQRDLFGDESWQRLLTSVFSVSDDANRVGLRLLGPSLAPEGGADVLSEGIVTGSIQVTGEGQAIVMLPGHATIGGYIKIATVVPDDWDRLGQLSPGDDIHFVEWS